MVMEWRSEWMMLRPRKDLCWIIVGYVIVLDLYISWMCPRGSLECNISITIRIACPVLVYLIPNTRYNFNNLGGPRFSILSGCWVWCIFEGRYRRRVRRSGCHWHRLQGGRGGMWRSRLKCQIQAQWIQDRGWRCRVEGTKYVELGKNDTLGLIWWLYLSFWSSVVCFGKNGENSQRVASDGAHRELEI